jgi:hypothetical protein
MGSLELQDRIPSCTACYFDLERSILPCPGRPDLGLATFLVDQQAVATWYLLLYGRQHLVVGSWINFSDLDEELDEALAEAEPRFAENTVVCAPSFEHFLHRFWFENTLWYALHEGDAGGLSREQEQYLDFYRRPQS